MKRWKPVVGWEGLYAVSELGEVWSVRRDRLMALSMSNNYLRVGLFRDGAQIGYNVHVLVAAAFHGPRPEGMQVCHKNGVSTDNRAKNLRYGTPQQNQADRLIHGTHSRGERNGSHRLTQSQVDEARARVAAGESRASVARSFGVHKTTIQLIVAGKLWRQQEEVA